MSLSEQEVEALANGVVINSRGFIHNPNCGQVAGNRFLRKPRAGDRLAGCCHRLSTAVAGDVVEEITARQVAAVVSDALTGHEGVMWKRDAGGWICRCGHPLTPVASPAKPDDAFPKWTQHVADIVRAQIHN